jgi:hypothetical protein
MPVEATVPGDIIVGLGTVAEWVVPADLRATRAKVVFTDDDPGMFQGTTQEFDTGTMFNVERSGEVALAAFLGMLSGEQDKALMAAATELKEGVTTDELHEALTDMGILTVPEEEFANVTEQARLNVETIATAIRRTLPGRDYDENEHAEMTGAVIDGMSEIELKSALYLACTYVVSITRDATDEEFTHIFNCDGHCGE